MRFSQTMKSVFCSKLLRMGAAAALFSALPAGAQTPQGDPLPKALETVSPTVTRSRVTERQSQLNPASKAHGDTTNRGRMSADFLWGVSNGNRTYARVPMGRVPDQGKSTDVQLDGYTFPYSTTTTGGVVRRKGVSNVAADLYPPVIFDDEVNAPSVVALTHPVTAVGTTGGYFAGTNWLTATQSSGFINTRYTRSQAIPRPAGALPDPGNPDDPNKFIWYPRVPGAPGTVGRYAIRIHIPISDTSGAEERITDARYVVSYIIAKPDGTYLHKRKVFTLSQSTSGDPWLVGEDGKPATFTFFSEATYSDPAWIGRPFANGLTIGDPLVRARVELDNTTENDLTGSQFVIADRVEFIQRLAAGSAKGTPTLTPPHGGRKVDTAQTKPVALPDPDPYDQPAKGANYGLDIWTPIGGLAFLNDSFNFINNPRDPAYTTLGNPLNGKFDAASPSTLFRGPESLIDPKDALGVSVAPINAENHQQYKDGLGNPVPFFSHLQVLVNKTDYIMDPETGTSDAELDGTKTLEVGSVSAYDWASGTLLWRFPDKTYLPARSSGAWRHPDNTLVAGAALRNPYNAVDGINLIPGIGAVDVNGNGKYDDDEIFLIGQGNNPNGGIDSSPTIVPNIEVMGDVQVPTYTALGGGRFEINGVVSAPLYRYSLPDPMAPLTERLPVYMPLAFVGSNNGVLYALDPFGNNDNQYIERGPTAPGVYASLGEFKAGTTNLLWTFSPTTKARVTAGSFAEPLDKYYLRLKGEIPPTGPFGAAAPVVAWAKSEDNDTHVRPLEEPRLFIGNQNSVLYALDPRANAGKDYVTGVGMASLPVRKGEQVRHTITAYNTPGAALPAVERHRPALKWWFETLGTINSSVAISDYAFPRNAGAAPVTASRRVFATTSEGRVYSLDWDGPVTKMDHEKNLVWDGTGGGNSGVEPYLGTSLPVPTTRPAAGTAAALNDNVRFHEQTPARPGARADLTEGTIRPVWTFPNRYADVSDAGLGAVDNRRGLDQPDESLAYPGFRLASPGTFLAAIDSAPVVMDFAMRDTDSAIAGLTGVRRYLVVAANDYDNQTRAAKNGRLLLLDQEGDRNDFLTNPMPTKATARFTPSDPAVTTTRPSGATSKPTPAANATIYSQPLDQYVGLDAPFGKASPVWTYRFIYDTYDGSNNPILTRRNRPTPGVAVEPTTGIAAPVTGEPARRTLPTVFWGGVGNLFALDIDEETGLLLRWRASGTAQPSPIPLDGSVAIPGNLSTTVASDMLNPNDPLNPFNPIFNVGNQGPGVGSLNLGLKHVMARTVPLMGDGSSVDGQIVVTGGPLQNRNNSTAITVAATLPQTQPAPLTAGTHPTVPLVPTLDAPVTKPILTIEPPVTVDPIGPILYNLAPFGYDLDLTASLAPAAAYPDALFLPIVDLTGRFVNQEIDDPLATTRGSWTNPVPPTVAEEQNTAYQYPTLLVTTSAGYLHEISTNIEGQDPSMATDPRFPGAGTVGNQFGPLGWAFTDGDPALYNPHGHVRMFSVRGPGGTGNGISVLTNAYFPSLDTGYARRKDRLAKQTAPTVNPTGIFLTYPKDEPRSTTSAYGDGPKAGLLPRTLYQGNAADATTTPPTPLVDPDWHTGQTGFPLDLNGLFYDKRFADGTGTNRNADGRLRLPAYDKQGELSSTPPPTGTGIPETNSERAAHVTAGTPQINDNPAGQNVTWIYTTGEDGIFYAYTPVMSPALGGVSSGYSGGQPNQSVPDGLMGRARVDVFSKNVFDALRIAARSGVPVRPDRDGTDAAWVNPAENQNDFSAPMAMPPFGAGRSVTDPNMRSAAAQGNKNIYEWGETIYVVAWDVTVVASESAAGVLSPIPASYTTRITISPANGRGQARTIDVPLERSSGTGLVSVYPYVGNYTVPTTDTPAGNRPAQLGLAFLELKLDERLGIPRTPGTGIKIDVTTNPPIGLGTLAIAQLNTSNGGTLSERSRYLTPQVYIANPLAVQGFAVSTNTGLPVQAAKAAGQPIAGGIGPFRTPALNDQTHVVRNWVAGQNPTTAMDPDLAGYQYSQALTNGNSIARYDYDRYVPDGMGGLRLNPQFGARLQNNGSTDPEFYVPVVTSTGYIGHGRTGSTDLSATQRNLRIVNRTTSTLSKVRAEVMNDLIWRWWPGRIPNADTDSGNPAITPVGMRADGRINPLPWEREVPQPQPWKRTGNGGNVVGLGNVSPDYPDIVAASVAQQGRQAISVLVGGTDVVQGPASLQSGQLTTSTFEAGATSPFLPSNPIYSIYGATVSVRVPLYQPANLVATHSLTSTYENPSTADNAQPFTQDGRVQLPRGLANRDLRTYNTGSGLFDGPYAITPFGYTSQVRVFVDEGSGNVNQDNDGKWEDGEPFRIVEVWTGVPVDMGLKSNETPVDLGALPAGFGIQNGVMGYRTLAPNNPGFLPDPIGRLNPTDPNNRSTFDKFFKKMTIQNIGNVNLYNLRSAQKTEVLTDTNVSSVNFFSYFGLVAETVDSRYGILAVGADPLLAANAPYTPANLMPQVVTSLDREFDTAFDAYLAAQAGNPASWLAQVTDNGQTVYQRYYAGMAGRHTLHKPAVGSATPSVLSLPDLPGNVALVPLAAPQPDVSLPALGVAVPVGTPAGVYRSVTSSSPIMPPSLAVFEDHDTVHPAATAATGGLTGYVGIPILAANASVTGGAQILPAGPLYAGQNMVPPGLNPIAPEEGKLRVRNFSTTGSAEFQPHTNPAVDIKLTVTETRLTGQIADFAQVGYDGIFSGVLNGIDVTPLLDVSGALPRPASLVTPAAYRGANGRIHVYYARNADATSAAQTVAGSPFNLFHSHLGWDETLGTFVADVPGVPVLDPTTNAGRWFTQEVMLATGVNESNLYPSVLQASPTATEATLFWVNSKPNQGALPTDTIQWTRLDANGIPVDNGTELIRTNNPNYQPDPTIRRFGPRAAFDSATRTGIVTFYGGAPGKQGLYYIPYTANPQGVPQSAGGRRGMTEVALPVPPGIVTATEPTPTLRRLHVPDHSLGSFSGASFLPTADTTSSLPVVDVVYSGVLRNTQTPDLFLSRYRFTADSTGTVVTGKDARLTLTALPVVNNERLVQVGRELAWQSKHVAWFVQAVPNTSTLTNLKIQIRRAGGATDVTQDNAWQFDTNSRRWVQVINKTNGVLYVYVDTDTGEVRFRGASEPTANDTVLATYQPTTYRLTPDSAPDTGAYVTTDTRLLPATPSTQVYRRLLNGAPAPLLSKETDASLSGVGRQWITWSKLAQPNRPARLYYAARRVGVDLRSTSVGQAGRLQRTESIALGPRDTTPGPTLGNQFPLVSQVIVANNPGFAGAISVPYEVDFSSGRIYVDAKYEGMFVNVQYTAAAGATTRNVTDIRDTVNGVFPRLGYIEELGATDAPSVGLQVPMQQTINEAQISTFIDLYNYDPSRPDLLRQYPAARIPDYTGDPTLQPGKLWMFWTSSRPRLGQVPGFGTVPSGFDLFYQTIAPRFELPSLSVFGQ